jgi:hypothetical protein
MQLEGDSGLEGGGGGDWSAKINVDAAGALVGSAWDTLRLICCGMCDVTKQYREADELQAQMRGGGPGGGGGGGRGTRFRRGMEILVVGLVNSAQHNGKRGRITGFDESQARYLVRVAEAMGPDTLLALKEINIRPAASDSPINPPIFDLSPAAVQASAQPPAREYPPAPDHSAAIAELQRREGYAWCWYADSPGRLGSHDVPTPYDGPTCRKIEYTHNAATASRVDLGSIERSNSTNGDYDVFLLGLPGALPHQRTHVQRRKDDPTCIRRVERFAAEHPPNLEPEPEPEPVFGQQPQQPQQAVADGSITAL